MSFWARGQDPSALTVQDYIDVYCEEGMQKVASLVPIDKIQNLSIRAIVQTIVRLLGNDAQHVASRQHMYYVIECQKPTVMDWCTRLLANLKSHINQCYLGRQKNFGYGSLLCSFFMERVSLMRP